MKGFGSEKTKTIRRILALGGVLCLTASVCFPIFGTFSSRTATVSRAAVTSASIQEKEREIEAARQEQADLRGRVTDLQGMRRRLENQKSDLSSYVAELDGDLEQIQENIAGLKLRIEEKQTRIKETKAQLEQARADEEQQYADMVKRIRRMYELGDPEGRVIELLSQAGSLRELMNFADFYQRVVEFDRGLYSTLLENRKYVELCEEQLEIEQQILNESMQNAKEEEAAIETLISEKKSEIEAYENQIATSDAAIREYEAQIRQQNEEIAMLETAIADEKRRILEAQGAIRRYDGGTFCQPLASYTRISDDYGYRIHPILKVQQFHNGVDFAAPRGTAIYAAYDGSVVAAGYSSSMGNYVMIDHGDELFTIYMHASALYVEKGDVVVKGETIAAVGSTGRSTGPHLHFSVRLNGEYVSPWNYLS